MDISKLFFRVLSFLIGAFFCISAFVKLFPIEILEIAVVETGIIGWSLSQIAARILIGFEFFIGLFLMTNFKSKLFSLFAIISLIVFTIYLSVLLVVQGNNINCNCMGLFMVMNPIESIAKNLVLLSLLAIIYFKNTSIKTNLEKLFIVIGSVLSLSLPFIISPPTFQKYQHEINKNEPFNIDFSIIYNNPEIEQPRLDLRKGKHLVGFFSSSCMHCIVTGYNLKVILDQNPEFSFYFFINGDDADLAHFHQLTKSESIPHSKLPGKEMITLAGNKLPAVYLIENSMVETRIYPDQIDEKELLKWFNE